MGTRLLQLKKVWIKRIRSGAWAWFRSVRSGLWAIAILHVSRALFRITRLKTFGILTTHFLYILNRHSELEKLLDELITPGSKFLEGQYSLHLIMKAAWILKNDQSLEPILTAITQSKAPALWNLAYITSRNTSHDLMRQTYKALVAKSFEELERLDPQGHEGEIKASEIINRMIKLEAYDLPKNLLTKICSISNGASNLMLAKHAAFNENWAQAYDFYLLSLEHDPNQGQIYKELADVTVYFDDALQRLNQILDIRTKSGVVITGIDHLQMQINLLQDDYLALLECRDEQVSNKVARSEYGDAASKSIGKNALPYEKTGGSVFVIGRDGVSDEARWSYYYSMLTEYYDKVSVSCDPRHLQLFKRSFPSIEFFPVKRNWGRVQVTGLAGANDRVPNMELASRLDNLAYAASKTADEVMFIEDTATRNWKTRNIIAPPAIGEPPGAHVFPDPDRVAYWQKELQGRFGSNKKIGILWRSGLIDPERARNYLKLDDFEALTKLPATFFSLQHEHSDLERQKGDELGIQMLDTEIDFYNDFSEIAAFTKNLDLVIGISTLPYEVSAAVGTPCWLCAIAPMGRWMRLGKSGMRSDRITRNGSVFCPQMADGYLQPRDIRVADIMNQIRVQLEREFI